MYPILLSINGFEVYSLGLFHLAGFALFNMLVVHLASRRGMKIGLWNAHVIVLTVSGIIGARALHVLTHWADYAATPAAVLLPNGFSYYGAMAAFALALAVLCHRRKESFLSWVDVFATAFFAYIAVVDVGHFLNGSNYGTPTNLPWGVTYDDIFAAVLYTVPVHPLQLYHAALALGAFALLYRLYRRTPRIGLVALMGGFVLGATDFVLQFFAGDDSLMLGALRIDQVFALTLLALCSSFLLSLFLRQIEE